MLGRISSFVTSGKILIFLLSMGCLDVSANHDLYGRIAIDSKHVSNTPKKEKFELENNESKIGIKGDLFEFNELGLKVIYQIEYGFDLVDGKARGDDGTFKQRNTFLGIKGHLGTIFAGTHDSALKKSQLKVDLFNDLAPDIKNILHGENRLDDFVGYTSPKFQGVLSVTVNKMKNPVKTRDDSKSYSINYSGDSFQAALAIDNEMKGYDSTRMSLLIPFNKSKLGFIFQQSQELSSGIEKNGQIISFAKEVSGQGMIKLQYASSSMKIDSGKHSTIGYDHLIDDNFKLFTFYSLIDSADKSKNKNIFSIGLEYKF